MAVEYAPRGLIGVLTPQANTTVEPEFAVLWPPGIAMINARLTSAKGTIEDRLVDYFDQLDETVGQFANAPVDAVAVACTGASYLAGVERERATLDRLRQRLGVPVATAATAVVDALQALSAERIGLVSPYPPGLTEASKRYWEAQGFTVGAVASVAPDTGAFHPIYSMRAAGAGDALEGLGAEQLDAVVMLGTGMPTLQPILERREKRGLPVISCMLCLAWASVEAAERRAPAAETLHPWIRGDDWGPRLIERRWPASGAAA